MTTYEIYLSITENDTAYYEIGDSKEVLETIKQEGNEESYIEIRKFVNDEIIETFGKCSSACEFTDMPKYIQKKVKKLSKYLK